MLRLFRNAFGLLLFCSLISGQAEESMDPVHVMQIDTVWAGHPVGFDFLTHGDIQFVAYYNAERHLTVASRKLGEDEWTRKTLDSQVGWDSHNYLTMTLDRDEHLHLSGNMHVSPLVYYRTEKPLDITTLQPLHRMTGQEETRTTYPRFMNDLDGNLLFIYRSGESGNGKRLINIYNEETKTWKRLIDQPLLDGTAQDMNAYPTNIQKGPEGWFHLVWMWRDSPDARTNHDISYAKSRDLKHWMTAGGDPLALPITPATRSVVVDPVPAMQGLINMGFGLGFDTENRPVVYYHKYDERGHSQIYLARWEADQWVIHQPSRWDHRWEFGGGGSIPSKVGVSHFGVKDGRPVVSWYHETAGRGTWALDPETLEVVNEKERSRKEPQAGEKIAETPAAKGPTQPLIPNQPKSDFPGMIVHQKSSRGSGGQPGARYVLRWETLPSNRDQPRDEPWPEAVPLEIYEVTAGE